jgi:hypothetical protein
MLLSLYYIHDNQCILLVTSSAADLEKTKIKYNP